MSSVDLSNPDIPLGAVVQYHFHMGKTPTKAVERIGARKPPKLFIRERMKEKHLTQAQVAARMDITEGTLSKLLNDQMEMTTNYLAGLSEAIGCDIAAFFIDPRRPTPSELLRDAPPEVVTEVIDFIRFKIGKA